MLPGIRQPSGWAYTHDGSSWIERQHVVPSDAIAGMYFGVDLEGQTLVAGAPFSTGRAAIGIR